MGNDVIDIARTLGLGSSAASVATVASAPANSELAPAADRRQRAARIERALLAKSFHDFANKFWPVVTGRAFAENKATRSAMGALQDVADGRTTRLLIAMPPGVGKSTMLALYAAWRLARDPSWRSIHASHAFDLAATESRRVRRLVESDEYRAVFPDVVLRVDENTVAHWSTDKDGRYFAVGVDSALTGRRANEAVLDDPLNAIDRFSKAVREGLWTWFTESLSTRLDNDRSPITCVQQRLDRDDLIGKLVEAGGWTIVELPAEDEQGELLAPNVLSREKLDALKAQIGAAAYATQYLQRPSDDSSSTVRRAWWRFHRPAHVALNAPRPIGCDTTIDAVRTPTRFDRIVIAVDMTFGATSKTADYAVAQVWGSTGGARYLLEQWRRRATQLEQREAIRDLASRYPTAKVLIEKAAGGPGAIEQLTADGIPRIVPVLTGGRGKAERLDVVSPTIEGGNAFLPLGAAWLGDFVEELAGAAKHDDMMDATAYALADLNATNASLWPELRRAREREQEEAARLALPETERPPPTRERSMTERFCLLFGIDGVVPIVDDLRMVPRKCEHRWLDRDDGRGTVCVECGTKPAQS